MTHEELAAAVTRRAIERYEGYPEWQRQELDYGLQRVAERTADIMGRSFSRGSLLVSAEPPRMFHDRR